MGEVVVRYKVKPGRVEENQRLVEAVYAELAERDPGGLRYLTLRLEDGVSFLHVASIDAEAGSNPLSAVSAFADFTRDIAERCDEPPVAQNAQLVGSYGISSPTPFALERGNVGSNVADRPAAASARVPGTRPTRLTRRSTSGRGRPPCSPRGPSSSVQRWARATREPGSSGLATRHFEGIKGQHGGRRVVYRTQDRS